MEARPDPEEAPPITASGKKAAPRADPPRDGELRVMDGSLRGLTRAVEAGRGAGAEGTAAERGRSDAIRQERGGWPRVSIVVVHHHRERA